MITGDFFGLKKFEREHMSKAKDARKRVKIFTAVSACANSALRAGCMIETIGASDCFYEGDYLYIHTTVKGMTDEDWQYAKKCWNAHVNHIVARLNS